MDESWGHYAKWNKPVQKTNTICFHLYELPRVVKFTETENRRVVAKSWGEENTGNCLIDIVSVLQDKKSSGVRLQNNVMYLTWLNSTLKMVKMVNFKVICILPQIQIIFYINILLIQNICFYFINKIKINSVWGSRPWSGQQKEYSVLLSASKSWCDNRKAISPLDLSLPNYRMSRYPIIALIQL